MSWHYGMMGAERGIFSTVGRLWRCGMLEEIDLLQRLPAYLE